MPVNTTHPAYDDQFEDWTTARVTVSGEKAIRKDITRYLPVPPGLPNPQTLASQSTDAGKKTSRYAWYAHFAEFPEIVAPTIEAFQGLIHMKTPEVTLPANMQYLIQTATPTGDSLDELWKKVTREMITTGRQVLLGEVSGDRVLSCPYTAESLTNWRTTAKSAGETPELAVITEMSFEPNPEDDFMHMLVTKYRELRLVDGQYGVRMWKSESSIPAETLKDTEGRIVQRTGGIAVRMTEPVVDPQPQANEDGFVFPARMGAAPAFIPLDVGNADGVSYDMGHIPVLPMSKRALSIFRRSADFNRALYNKGDPQAWISGIEQDDLPETIGGGEIWAIPSGEATGYLDIDGAGIPLMREAINDDYDRFVQEAGRFLETNDRTNPNESGRAVEKRLSAQRVTLRSLVIEAGRLMEKHLRTLGKMLGLGEAELEAIKFVPNMDFTELKLSGQELLQLIQAKNMGAPWSLESMHAYMKSGGLTDKQFSEEMAAIRTESSLTGEPPPDPVLTTGEADGHSHTYKAGMAQTGVADGHAHPILPDGSIGEADGHTHTPDQRALDMMPEPAEPSGDSE